MESSKEYGKGHDRWVELDSVVFQTEQLDLIRSFYESKLKMQIALYTHDGQITEDVSEQHVNYRVGHSLIGFEVGDNSQTGSLVLRTKCLKTLRKELHSEVIVSKDLEWFISFIDPDGREVIVEETERGPALVESP